VNIAFPVKIFPTRTIVDKSGEFLPLLIGKVGRLNLGPRSVLNQGYKQREEEEKKKGKVGERGRE
jgi:hypothetical protein